MKDCRRIELIPPPRRPAVHAENATIENGFVFLPETAPCRRDDQVELDRMRRWPGRRGGEGRGGLAGVLSAAGGVGGWN